VRRQTLAQWTSGQSDNGRTGFGFMVLGDGRARAFGHNGGAPGMGTWFLVYPEQGLVAVTLTNRDPALMGWIQQPLMRALTAR
jgi:CubicO group peptidase (beta-lactamase class C family)